MRVGGGGTENRSFDLEDVIPSDLGGGVKFQAILKPIFTYSITSILSKVRYSNTLFLAISFAFPCHQV